MSGPADEEGLGEVMPLPLTPSHRPKHTRNGSQAILAHLNKVETQPPPTPEQLGTNASELSPHSHALQRDLSYPVLPLDLLDGPGERRRRPQVYVKRPNGDVELARYGTDMFRLAEINLEKPLVIVRQSATSFDVTISAIQTMDWLDALGDDSEDLSVQIVPAGSFSYRKTPLGTVVRGLMRFHRMYTQPLTRCGITYPPVRVAGVVIPRVKYQNESNLIITQRVTRRKGGTYNGLWVFPGGHVEARESLVDGARREFMEETGLILDSSSMKLITCWQEVMPAKSLQFLMLVYSAEVISGPAGFSWDQLALQKEEVASLALLPESVWRDVANRGDCEVTVPGVTYTEQDEEGNSIGDFQRVEFPCNEITGFELGFGRGIGSGHRYALMQYLDPFDKHIPSTTSSIGPLSALMRGRSTGNSYDSWEEDEPEDHQQHQDWEDSDDDISKKQRYSRKSAKRKSSGKGTPVTLVQDPEDLPL